jgi:hypothetical protein
MNLMFMRSLAKKKASAFLSANCLLKLTKILNKLQTYSGVNHVNKHCACADLLVKYMGNKHQTANTVLIQSYENLNMKKTQISDLWNMQNEGRNDIPRLLKEDIVTSSLHDTVMVFRDGMVKSHSVILASISQNFRQIMEVVPEVDTKYVIIPSVSTNTWTQFDDDIVPGLLDKELLELADVLGVSLGSGNDELTSDDIKIELIQEDDCIEDCIDDCKESFFGSICDEDNIHASKLENSSPDSKPNKSTEQIKIPPFLSKTPTKSECEKCKETFQDRYALKKHLYASPCSGKSEYQLTAIAASLAIIEEKVFDRRKVYECKECQREFKTPYSFRAFLCENVQMYRMWK